MNRERELESWRKTFILQLYENTKDAVEVAKRHYLESRLANGLKREMYELREKYQSYCKQEESQAFLDTLEDFRLLEEEIDEAIGQLKVRSDEFVQISAHKLPSKAEYLTYDEILRVKLPNYSRFLFNPEIKSFGPISEKWEKVKAGFNQEFMNLLTLSPRLSLGRSLLSESSSRSESISIEDKDDAKLESAAATPATTSSDPSLDQPREPSLEKATDRICLNQGPNESPDNNSQNPEEAPKASSSTECDSKAVEDKDKKCKPEVAKRIVKQNSFKRTLSGAWQQIITSAAQSAGNKRIPSHTEGRKTVLLDK